MGLEHPCLTLAINNSLISLLEDRDRGSILTLEGVQRHLEPNRKKEEEESLGTTPNSKQNSTLRIHSLSSLVNGEGWLLYQRRLSQLPLTLHVVLNFNHSPYEERGSIFSKHLVPYSTRAFLRSEMASYERERYACQHAFEGKNKDQ